MVIILMLVDRIIYSTYSFEKQASDSDSENNSDETKTLEKSKLDSSSFS